ncbi:MAG TPA: long-chain-fatty-acid--CoA ligase, partial [Nitriliruptorales bacterium]
MHDTTWPLRHALRHFPDRPAVVCGDIRLTFAELVSRCNRLGTGLRSRGVGTGDRVATLLTNSHRYLELHLAIPGIGALIVPLNSRLAVVEMAQVIDDAGAEVLVVDEAHARLADKLADHVARVIRIPDEYEALIDAADDVPLPGPPHEDHVAGLYYTGGTTGLPKGVMLTHRNHMANGIVTGYGLGLEPGDTLMYVFPLFHLGAIASIYISVWQGVEQVFVPEVEPGRLLRTIQDERITAFAAVPTVLNFLLAHPDLPTTDLSSLRLVIHGGAPIAPDLCRRVADELGCAMMQAYGMTEAAAIVTLLRDEQELLDHERITSGGQANIGVEVEVRRDDGTPCDAREAGEIVVRGPNVMPGYWNRPEETAAALRDGWYWTGDVGFLDEEGYLFVVDRAKDMIVTGGENVYSVEVENALASHPDVFEVAVIGIPHDTWGEAVHAVVVPRPGTSPTEQDLISHCRASIAGYKTPKSIDLV